MRSSFGPLYLTDFPGFPSFKDSFKLYPDFVWVLTAKDKEDMEVMQSEGRKVAEECRARRLSTQGVKADMIAIGRGEK